MARPLIRLPDVGRDECAAISAEFDRDYYLRRYEDVARARVDPVAHYIQYGAREGRDPSPEFGTSYYLNRYRDVRQTGLNPFYHYLTIGRAEGRSATPFGGGDPDFDAFCEILGHAPAEVAQELVSRRRDLRARLERGVLGQMVARASELEPLIHRSWPAAMTARLPPFHSAAVVGQVIAMHRLQDAAGWRRARAVVVTPASEVHDAARIAGHLATALVGLYGRDEIVVLRTDSTEIGFPVWFPDGCRRVDFVDIARNMQPDDRQRLLVEFLRSLRPAAVFNVNSSLLWDAMLPYGRALASSTALYAYFFNDPGIYGDWVGSPLKEFYRHFDILHTVITDSNYLANDLRTRFQIPPSRADKLVTLDTPIGDQRDASVYRSALEKLLPLGGRG